MGIPCNQTNTVVRIAQNCLYPFSPFFVGRRQWAGQRWAQHKNVFSHQCDANQELFVLFFCNWAEWRSACLEVEGFFWTSSSGILECFRYDWKAKLKRSISLSLTYERNYRGRTFSFHGHTAEGRPSAEQELWLVSNHLLYVSEVWKVFNCPCYCVSRNKQVSLALWELFVLVLPEKCW